MNHRAAAPPPPLTLGAALARALRDHGVSHLFTIPGDFVLPLVAAIERDQSLPLVTLSHEPALAFAADAAARATGRPGAVLVTYGAGALNLVNAVANAYVEMSPLVVIAGAPSPAECAPGRVIHHQARAVDSQRRVFEEVTCAQAILDDPATAPDAIAHVLRTCVARSRPVYIEVPRDLGAAPVAPVPPLAASPASPASAVALGAAVAQVLRALAAAPRVALLAGAEVRRRGLDAAVAALAHHLGAPLATSFMGRGVARDVPGAPLVGVWHGRAGHPDARAALDAADLVLRLGVIPSDSNLGPVAAEAARAPRVVAAHDGAVLVAGHRLGALEVPLAPFVHALRAAAPPRAPWYRPAAAPALPHPAATPPGPLSPDGVAAALNAAFARHGAPTLVCDTGDALFLASRVDHGALIAPSCYATMGFAVPAALGVQLATGARPVALVGDGAFQMTGLELAACARLGCDPIVVVLNNASWETIRVFYPDGAAVAAPLHALEVHDCAAIARALGGVGRVVSTPGELGAGLEDALTSRGRFYLLDVRLPRGVVTSTLHRFAGMLRGEPAVADAPFAGP